MRQSPFLLLLLLLAAAPSAAQQPTQAYVGCYRLLQGSWDPHLRSGFHPSPGQLPPAILLDSLPLAGWPMEDLQGARQARSLSLPNDRSFSFRFWQHLDPDTLFVATPLPSTGLLPQGLRSDHASAGLRDFIHGHHSGGRPEGPPWAAWLAI
jgi:hypothetical protein